MTESQYLLLLGTVWIAPRVPEKLALFFATAFVLISICKIWGSA